jgi:hypothetical protein
MRWEQLALKKREGEISHGKWRAFVRRVVRPSRSIVYTGGRRLMEGTAYQAIFGAKKREGEISRGKW